MMLRGKRRPKVRRPRRNHSPAFKALAAVAGIKGEETLVELAQDFDLHLNQINQWRDQLLEGATGVFGEVPEGRSSFEGRRKDPACEDRGCPSSHATDRSTADAVPVCGQPNAELAPTFNDLGEQGRGLWRRIGVVPPDNRVSLRRGPPRLKLD